MMLKRSVKLPFAGFNRPADTFLFNCKTPAQLPIIGHPFALYLYSTCGFRCCVQMYFIV